MKSDTFALAPDVVGVAAELMRGHANYLSGVAETMMLEFLRYGVPEDKVPHLMMHTMVLVAALLGHTTSQSVDHEPSRDRWNAACDRAFSDAAEAFAASKGGVA